MITAFWEDSLVKFAPHQLVVTVFHESWDR